jgi:hypothetical protein
MFARIESFHRRGLVVRRWPRRERIAIYYGELLTVERRVRSSGLVLHTRTLGDIRVIGLRGQTRGVEDELRTRGVRIVDCWGAIIAPTVADFTSALAEKSGFMGQSSDDA